jgi:hypothetical protein
MWQGLHSITDYNKKTSTVVDIDILLKLNNFFARFEDNTVPLTRPATKACGLSFTMANVSKTFKCVNPRKAAGIDYSSAFNTIVPSKLVIKHETLGLDPAMCNWVLDFLTACP